MVKSRWWLVSGGVCVALGMASSALGESPLSKTETTVLIERLHSDRHEDRDAALVDLVQHGPAVLARLVSASIDRDPETSWRAAEALQIVCRTLESPAAQAAKKELTSLSKSPDKAIAAIAKNHLQHWPQYRHEHAASQLEMLGAQIGLVDFSQQTHAVDIDGGAMFGGGPIFAEVLPAVERVLDAPEIIEAEVEALPVEEEVVEEPAEPAEKPKRGGGILGGIFRAVGRVAADVHEAEEARSAIAERIIEEKIAGRDKEMADVEVIEAPPDAAPMIEEFDIPILEDVAIPDRIMIMEMAAFDAVEALETEASVPSGIEPGRLLLDKAWRGADEGLVHAAQLQQIHTVEFRQAAVTDRALAHLRNIKTLIRLEVQGTQITGAALQKFKHDRPQVEVVAIGSSVLGITGTDHHQGVQVQGVMSETGARRAGLLDGDIVTRMNDLRIRSFNDLTLALYDKQPGETVRIDYLRGGKKQSADVVLTARAELPAPSYVVPQMQQHWAVPHGRMFMPPGGFFGFDR